MENILMLIRNLYRCICINYFDQSKTLALNFSNNSCMWQKILSSQFYEWDCLCKWANSQIQTSLEAQSHCQFTWVDCWLCSLFSLWFTVFISLILQKKIFCKITYQTYVMWLIIKELKVIPNVCMSSNEF